MIERALRFGDSTPLVGVLAQPDAATKVSGAPAVLLLNSGIMHHIGANRLYVRIARTLAERGFTSLRFDFSGVGDSEPRRDALPFEKSAVLETREAMEYLGRVSGASEFVLAGLCSGADMSYFTALEDPRVVGLAQLDAFVYRTPKWYVKRFGPRLLSLSAWINGIRTRLRDQIMRIRGVQDEPPEMFVAPEYRRVFPPKRTVQAGMSRLSDRGVRLFFTFTGDEQEILYREQYEDSFRSIDFGDLIQVEYMPESDHTFSGIRDQSRVVRLIADWVDEGWGSGRSGENARRSSVTAEG